MDDLDRETVATMALSLRHVTFTLGAGLITTDTEAETVTLLEARSLIEQALDKLAGLCPELDVLADPPRPMSRAERRRDAAQFAQSSIRRPGR